MATREDEQAVLITIAGPLRSKKYESLPAAVLVIVPVSE
jgi:hypothetical protein